MRRSAVWRIAQASLPILTRLDPETAHDLGLAGLRWVQPLWPELKVSPSLSVRWFWA